MAFVYWVRLPEHKDVFTEGYVGVTSQPVMTRFSQHLSKAKKNENLPFQNALRKYGRHGLVVDTLVIGDVDYVYDLENKLRPDERIGWNCSQGGDRSSLGRIKKQRSVEHCVALSKSLSGRKHSTEHLQSMSNSMKERWLSKHRGSGSATNTNHLIWSLADVIYVDRLNGLSGGHICKKYGIDKLSSIHSMIYVHFKNGWIPSSDQNWLDKYKGNINGGSQLSSNQRFVG
jgi:hypothetical protein